MSEKSIVAGYVLANLSSTFQGFGDGCRSPRFLMDLLTILLTGRKESGKMGLQAARRRKCKNCAEST